MTLLEKINRLNLKPRNAPAGVKVSTFGEWLRKLRAGQDIGEIPAALLTLYCDGQINESGGLKLGSAEISSREEPIVEPRTDTYGASTILETINEETAQKIPAKTRNPLMSEAMKQITPAAKKKARDFTDAVNNLPARSVMLHSFATNTMDLPMTRKLRSDKGINYWVLYCAKNKYRLELADVGCSIETEEGTFVLSDFAKK